MNGLGLRPNRLRLDVAKPVVRPAVGHPVDSLAAEERIADDIAAVEDAKLQQRHAR